MDSVPVPSLSSSSTLTEEVQVTALQMIELLTSTTDEHGGVIVEMDKPMDSATFVSILRASISHWKQLVGSSLLHYK